jgi:hypothetical protein
LYLTSGYFFASFSLISTPKPGDSFTCIYQFVTVGVRGNTSLAKSEKWFISWIAKLHMAKSICTLAACPTGDVSPGPCHAVLPTLNHSPNFIGFSSIIILQCFCFSAYSFLNNNYCPLFSA